MLRLPAALALLLALTLAGPVARAAEPAADAASLEDLLLRARAMRLAEDPAWLRLGHWRRKATGVESEVDGMSFFRALRGKTSPSAELEATLRAIFDARPVADELSDAQCRYPARTRFLRARLGIDEARLPTRPCPGYQHFVDLVAARSVTLVFSSYYLNNPVSSFGHTFLRLNKADEARVGKRFELLDIGIDYSALPDTNNPIAYALKGLFGAFPGRFNRLAYYYKVREYADAESRDLWEYDLALEPDEVQMLVAHLWELGSTYFDYWYLDENCSYHVLDAVEAAVPRVTLLDHVGAVVLPSDTIKALFENPGFVRSVHYRPSIRTQFDARVRGLDRAERRLVDEVVSRPSFPFPAEVPPARRAAILDAAVDLIDLRHFRNLAVDAAPEAARTRQLLLERRAELRVQSPELVVPLPEDRAPERGHDSFRLGVGGGSSTRDGGFAVLDLRVALHDLGDPPDGYPSLSQIEFLPTRLRLGFEEKGPSVQLDEIWALRIVSLNDASTFDLRPSWRLRAGAATIRDRGCAECLAGSAEVGGGFAKVLGPLDLYAGLDASVEGSGHLDGIGGSGFRAGIGPGGIARLRLGKRVALLAEGRWRWLPDATPGETFELAGTLRLHLLRWLSLSVEARRVPVADELGVVAQAFY